MLKQILTILSVVILSAVILTGCEDTAMTGSEEITEKALTTKITGNAIEAEMPAKGVITQSANVFGQGPDGPVVSEDGATIRRTPNGISIKLTMPVPEPGSYDYPTEGTAFSGPGHPEVFSLWAFVYNDPSAENWDGAFATAGHVVSGSTLTLSGNVSLNSEPFLGTELENPQGAEVHLAVAPHGALEPDLLPEALRTPTGPGPNIWWMAIFEGEE